MSIPFSDPVLIFASVMVLILVAPLLARRLKLPEIVGLILAGVIFGPNGLGVIERDATIRLLGQVGLLLIMFLAGLEIDLHQVRRNRLHSVVFGVFTFVIPLAVGTGLAVWIMAATLPTAVLLASMYSSHTLLTFPAAVRLRLTRHRVVTTTIGGTIITDTLALLVLAAIASSVQGDSSLRFWLGLGGWMTLYVVAVIVLLPRLGRWFLRNVARDEIVAYVFVLAVTFLTAYLAHLAGLEPIIGAFLAGLTLNSLIPEKSSLMGRLHFTGNALFIPFFLLSVGMLVDVRLLLRERDAWVVVAVMTGTALVTKLLAALISGKLLRYNRRESLFMYGLSVNQAAATLAAALVGYDIGLFNDSIITGTIVMIGVTCFVGPIVTERAGRRIAAEQAARLSSDEGPPSRILVSVEERKEATELLNIALYLREEDSHEPVYPVHVVPDGPDAEREVARGEDLLAHMVVRALAANAEVNPQTMVDVNISAGLVRAVKENRISTLVMGWDGVRSTGTGVFGRVLDTVVADISRQVLVNRIIRPVSTAERIVLLVPPLADHEIGLPEAVHTVKRLASQCGLSMLVMVDEHFPDASWKFIRQARPAVESTLKRYQSWKAVAIALQEECKPGDWIVMLTSRLGSVSWQPTVNRLPGTLAAVFPENNLSLLCLAGEPGEFRAPGESRASGDEQQPQSVQTAVFSADRSIFASPQDSIRTVLEEVLRLLPDQTGGSFTRLVHHLEMVAGTEPVELIPDVVLLHTRTPEVDRCEILLSVTEQPLTIPGLSQPAHIVIILLDPPDQEPAEHLASLGRIAAAIRSQELLERLRNARRYEDLA